jgi:hypothetical protein
MKEKSQYALVNVLSNRVHGRVHENHERRPARWAGINARCFFCKLRAALQKKIHNVGLASPDSMVNQGHALAVANFRQHWYWQRSQLSFEARVPVQQGIKQLRPLVLRNTLSLNLFQLCKKGLVGHLLGFQQVQQALGSLVRQISQLFLSFGLLTSWNSLSNGGWSLFIRIIIDFHTWEGAGHPEQKDMWEKQATCRIEYIYIII